MASLPPAPTIAVKMDQKIAAALIQAAQKASVDMGVNMNIAVCDAGKSTFLLLFSSSLPFPALG